MFVENLPLRAEVASEMVKVIVQNETRSIT